MLMRILLVLLVIFVIWIGIKILVRAVPELFSNPNRRKLNNVGGRLPIISSGGIGSLAKIFLLLNIAPAIAGSVARREQVNILKGKIKTLRERGKKLALVEIKRLAVMTKSLDEQLDDWDARVERNEFEFVELQASIDQLGRNFKKYVDAYVETDLLLDKCFELLKQAAAATQNQDDLKALADLEDEFNRCRAASFIFGQVKELDDLFSALKEKEKILTEHIGPAPTDANVQENEMSYYEILGVDPAATLAEIATAYRREINRWHPDKKNAQVDKIEDADIKEMVQDEIERLFRRVREAYEVLSDPIKRAAYDATRRIK
ncbi:MAG: DnaJ domain-containing protein [Patescibacteria group bacterium]